MAEEARILYPIISNKVRDDNESVCKDSSTPKTAQRINELKPLFIRPSTIQGMGRTLFSDFWINIAVVNCDGELYVFASIDTGNITGEGMTNDDNNGWPKAIIACSTNPFCLGVYAGNKDKLRLAFGHEDSAPQQVINYTNAASIATGTEWHNGTKTIVAMCTDFGIYCPSNGGTAKAMHGSWLETNPSKFNPASSRTVGLPKAYFLSNPAYANYTQVEKGGFVISGVTSFSDAKRYMNNRGYSYISKLNDFTKTTVNGEDVFYANFCGICLFNSETPNSLVNVWSWSKQVKISGLEQFLDYYPWERKKSSEWWSLNANGGPHSQTTYGLFRKYNNKWNPVSNTNADDESKQHGFRKINRQWTKSPKSGKGA